MDKKRAVILGILLLFSFAVLFASFRSSGRPPGTAAQRARPAPEPQETGEKAVGAFWNEAAAVLARAGRPEPPAAWRPVRRNPMHRPPPDPEFTLIIREPEKELVLSGILMGKRAAFAIINGEVVQPGDDLGDVLVTSVEAGRVILHAGPERREIVLAIE